MHCHRKTASGDAPKNLKPIERIQDETPAVELPYFVEAADFAGEGGPRAIAQQRQMVAAGRIKRAQRPCRVEPQNKVTDRVQTNGQNPVGHWLSPKLRAARSNALSEAIHHASRHLSRDFVIFLAFSAAEHIRDIAAALDPLARLFYLSERIFSGQVG